MPRTLYLEILLLLAISAPASLPGFFYQQQGGVRSTWPWLGLLIVELLLLTAALLLFPTTIRWHWPGTPKLMLVIPATAVAFAGELLLLWLIGQRRIKFFLLPAKKYHRTIFYLAAAASSEELLYRGILVGLLQAYLPILPALLIANIIFSFIHSYQGWAAISAKFYSGAVYSLLLLLSSSLLLPMLAHLLQNIMVAILARRAKL